MPGTPGLFGTDGRLSRPGTGRHGDVTEPTPHLQQRKEIGGGSNMIYVSGRTNMESNNVISIVIVMTVYSCVCNSASLANYQYDNCNYTLKPIFHKKTGLRWVPDANEI